MWEFLHDEWPREERDQSTETCECRDRHRDGCLQMKENSWKCSNSLKWEEARLKAFTVLLFLFMFRNYIYIYIINPGLYIPALVNMYSKMWCFHHLQVYNSMTLNTVSPEASSKCLLSFQIAILSSLTMGSHCLL